MLNSQSTNTPFFIILSLINFISVLLKVTLFDASVTDPYAAIVSELWHLDEILCALGTHCRATLATVVLSLKEAELSLAQVASVDLLIDPFRSLCDLKVLNPSNESIMTHISLCAGHSNNAGSKLFVNVSTRDVTFGAEPA